MSKKKPQTPQQEISERAARSEKFETRQCKPLSRNPLILFGVAAIIGFGVHGALMGKRSSADDYFTRVANGKDPIPVGVRSLINGGV